MSLVEGYATIASGLAAMERDPLRLWTFAVPRLREAFSLFTAPDPIKELHLRACNKGTKTESTAAFMVACLQKRPTLDGARIPQWRASRIEGCQFVLDYKVQIMSVQAAYRRVLGSWPHKVQREGQHVSGLLVMPVGGDPTDESGWSILQFLSLKNNATGVGFRGHVAAFDEPPPMSVLQEMRKFSHAGQVGLRVIAETPTKRSQWYGLREDYGDHPRRRITRVDQDRAECRWSLEDVSDLVLSPAEKAELRRSYARDPIADAREHGDYQNAVGESPWGEAGVAVLQAMLKSDEVRAPEIKLWRITAEVTREGQPEEVHKVPVQVFGAPEPGKRYYVNVDPASGKGTGNPLAVLVVEFGTCNLMARWNGHMAPSSVGVLAAGLGRQYNMAPIDVEMNDSWGVNVVRGIREAGYGESNLCHARRELRPGEWAIETGWRMDKEAKAAGIGCILDWLDARASGIVYALCPSRDVLETLLDAQMDEEDKIVASPGIDHLEDMILWGQALRQCLRRYSAQIPSLNPVVKSREQRLIERIQSGGREDFAPFTVRGKRAPRM